MTEQEKRDYLILEMAQQLCEAAGISCQNCPKAHSPEEFGECELPEICNTLADYVLRKEEEVQKETAKKIIKHLREKGHFTFDYPDDPAQNVHFGESIFEELEDMFGIEEVEE